MAIDPRRASPEDLFTYLHHEVAAARAQWVGGIVPPMRWVLNDVWVMAVWRAAGGRGQIPHGTVPDTLLGYDVEVREDAGLPVLEPLRGPEVWQVEWDSAGRVRYIGPTAGHGGLCNTVGYGGGGAGQASGGNGGNSNAVTHGGGAGGNGGNSAPAGCGGGGAGGAGVVRGGQVTAGYAVPRTSADQAAWASGGNVTPAAAMGGNSAHGGSYSGGGYWPDAATHGKDDPPW